MTMNDTKQPVSEKSPEYLAATLREVAETLDDVGKTIDARLGAWAATPSEPEPEPPRPEEEPKTVSIPTLGNFTVKFAAITSITAAWGDGRACLRVVGDGNSMTHVFTTTPLADIRKQADEARIDLPEVTVQLGTAVTLTFSAITRIYIDASLRQHIAGKRADYDKPDTGYGTCGATIPQVLALCKLAGWPKPEVRCVFTFCDGEPCEVDPASVCSVDTIRLPGERSTLVTCEDGGTSCFVRESVAVVEAMRDACKEGE